jgi:chemotaxis protein methyltransferase CheR
MMPFIPKLGPVPAIVDSIGAPVLLLDQRLEVILANRTYCDTFGLRDHEVIGRHLHDLGCGEWNIPDLHVRLEALALNSTPLKAYNVEAEFHGLGRRALRLDAATVTTDPSDPSAILVTITDLTEITAMRGAELELKELLDLKEILLKEMSHRIANSLAILANILLARARSTEHHEAKSCLEEAYRRVISTAELQKQLGSLSPTDTVEISQYLSTLCEGLAASLIGQEPRVSLDVRVPESRVNADHASPLGLIVTELVINSLKHGFSPEIVDGHVVVTYESVADEWRLKVCDNGVGGVLGGSSGLGTMIVKMLAEQMMAIVEVSIRKDGGRTVTIRHGNPPSVGLI